MMHSLHTRNAGFTIIELVVVMAIIVLLAGIAFPVVADRLDEAKNARAMAELDGMAKAFNTHKLDCNRWPTHSGRDRAIRTRRRNFRRHPSLFTNTGNYNGWNGPYVEKGYSSGRRTFVAGSRSGKKVGFADPWDNYYTIYTYTPGGSYAKGGIVLICRGPNGVLETSQSRAFNGEAGGDDLVKIVTKRL